MSTTRFSPALPIVALAGNKEAATEAAFDALNKGLACIIGHGDKRTLTDTLQALAACKGTQGKLVRGMTQAAYDEAMQSVNAGKGLADKGAALAKAMTDRYAADYITGLETAADARAEKSAERKIAKEKETAKATREAEKTAQAAASAAQPLTIARAAAFLQAACMAGSDEAFSAVIELAERFCKVVDETPAPVTALAQAMQAAVH